MTRYETTQHDILTIRHLKTENQHEQIIKNNDLKNKINGRGPRPQTQNSTQMGSRPKK